MKKNPLITLKALHGQAPQMTLQSFYIFMSPHSPWDPPGWGLLTVPVARLKSRGGCFHCRGSEALKIPVRRSDLSLFHLINVLLKYLMVFFAYTDFSNLHTGLSSLFRNVVAFFCFYWFVSFSLILCCGLETPTVNLCFTFTVFPEE